jgi:N4-gp56 family major capsid protein
MANEDLTQLEQMIDPDVMSDMIQADLPKAIKFAKIAPIDNTLEGRPGDTITVPRWRYIGDAEDVAEGGAIQYAQLTSDTDTFTVKKAGKGVKFSDESVLSGMGNPVGEGQRQLTMSIGSKIDNDILAAAMKARLTKSDVDVTKLDVFDAIEDAFDDDTNEYATEGDEELPAAGILFLNPKDARKLRKAAADDWTRATELGDKILASGAIGQLLGWEIHRSKKMQEGSGLAIKPGALRTYVKRAVQAEKDRDITHKVTLINVDQHYGVAIYDDTKLLTIKPFDVAGGTVLDQNVSKTPNTSIRKSAKGKAATVTEPSK